jgi:hypothetical protein
LCNRLICVIIINDETTKSNQPFNPSYEHRHKHDPVRRALTRWVDTITDKKRFPIGKRFYF